jgi:ribosomally synthesized peptide (two-chain TOMM family)
MPQVTEDLIWAMEEMLEWQEVWLAAVALSWRDPGFKERLLKDPRTAIAESFGYNLPPFLKLKLTDGSKLPPQYGWHAGGQDGWSLPVSDLDMVLPAPPADIKDQAVALADYSSAGRTYPFTTF